MPAAAASTPEPRRRGEGRDVGLWIAGSGLRREQGWLLLGLWQGRGGQRRPRVSLWCGRGARRRVAPRHGHRTGPGRALSRCAVKKLMQHM